MHFGRPSDVVCLSSLLIGCEPRDYAGIEHCIRRRLGLLRAEGPCATGDHLQLHEGNRNHALVVEAVHKIA